MPYLPAALWHDPRAIAAVTIFAASYLVIAIGKLPGYRLDRAGAALLGASLMVGFGVLSLDDAYHAVDWNTIALLLGMLIVAQRAQRDGVTISFWDYFKVGAPLTVLTILLGVWWL